MGLGAGFKEASDRVVADLAARSRNSEVKVDPTLPEYGCIVETELGWVDESVDSRLATMLHALKPET